MEVSCCSVFIIDQAFRSFPCLQLTADLRQYLNYVSAQRQDEMGMPHHSNTPKGGREFASLGGLSEHQVQFIVAQLILALGYCHSLGILQRDVKPENILVTRDGYIKLTDYGIAKEPLPYIDQCRSTSGTHGYMAPEIYANKHVHGRTADWFAVAVTAYELLTRDR